VFGIKETRVNDAAFFDAPTDAPFACPVFGAPPPVFSLTLHQETIETCVSYHASATLAAGSCFDMPSSLYVPMVGPLHAPLQIEPGLPKTNMITHPYQYYSDPHPSTDGTHLYIRHQHEETSFQVTIDVYTLAGGAWSFSGTLPSSTAYPTLIGIVSTAAGDRMILDEGANETEWSPDGSGGYMLVGTHPPSDLGITSIQDFAMSHDGLHAVLEGYLAGAPTPAVFWTQRASLNDWFTPVQPLPGVPLTSASDMTDDCGRVYFAALGSIIYVQRE